MPIAVVIISALFAVQRRGTAGIGAIFGPVTADLVHLASPCSASWASSGSRRCCAALNPWYAVDLPLAARVHRTDGAGRGGAGGHRRRGAVCRHGPLRQAADPGGLVRGGAAGADAQLLRAGAPSLLESPAAARNPFYSLVPDWALYPMVAIATGAAVVASQALISGAFSLTRQAIQLGYCPRVNIVHTSRRTIGQIYIPAVNNALLARLRRAGAGLPVLEQPGRRPTAWR